MHSRKTSQKAALHRHNNGFPIFFQLQKLNGDCNEELVWRPKRFSLQRSNNKEIRVWDSIERRCNFEAVHHKWDMFSCLKSSFNYHFVFCVYLHILGVFYSWTQAGWCSHFLYLCTKMVETHSLDISLGTPLQLLVNGNM